MHPMDTLSTLLSLLLWVVGGGCLLLLTALFVGIGYMLIATCVQTMRNEE